ncbi:unnamed protein product [Schistosoma mattheei]|uniref:RING-type domain-containing protein n=1 Tax=Schistosoma mattheei TaxID=31246 RepID=A0A3P8IAG6_9TREM|nr:unnamed protein product [Schistosoma mattheei]
MREVALCRVCMDQPISRVFFPCGHTICCSICADRVDQCPVCRKSIEIRHPCYLPWNTESNSEEVCLLPSCTFKDVSDRFKSHRHSRHHKNNTTLDSALHETASAPSCQLSSFIHEISKTSDRSSNILHRATFFSNDRSTTLLSSIRSHLPVKRCQVQFF